MNGQPEVGPIGRNVITNVDRIRQQRHLSWRKLSAELEKTGRPIPPLGLSRFAKAQRRTDADEVVALAEVLQVPPHVLLMAPEDFAAAMADIPAPLQAARNLATCIEQLLAASGTDADREWLSGNVDRALRRLAIEVEKLLADIRKP